VRDPSPITIPATWGVGQVVESLTGNQPSASTVSRVFHTLDDEFGDGTLACEIDEIFVG